MINMKKWICMICVLCALAMVFAGCNKEQEVQETVDEANCTRYEFVQWYLDKMVHSAEEVAEVTGNSDLYLKLYPDGTAQMCISDKVQDMKYEGETIWLVDEPNNKMILTIEGDDATIVDGGHVFQFSK